MSLASRILGRLSARSNTNIGHDENQSYPSPKESSRTTGVFEGFPYLVTRICPGLYHTLLLPEGLRIGDLVILARDQVLANRMRACLVFGADSAIYFKPDGSESPVTSPPLDGRGIMGPLQPILPLPVTPANRLREQKLTAYVQKDGFSGYVIADITKGGRDATEAEIRSMSGFNSAGVPKGLYRCQVCGGWCGLCIDPNPTFALKVMEVYCHCQNDNLCARCGHALYGRKLNANYYKPEDGGIWHVPGFLAFEHKCPEQRQNDR